jgi:deoxyribonuclease V
MTRWPSTADELMRLQSSLGALETDPWRPTGRPLMVAGCFICFDRRGDTERAWAGACLLLNNRVEVSELATGTVDHPYRPGLLALREGPLLQAAVERLPRPDVLLVNATGRDHPRGAGLALHLGWTLGLPTVGVTDRPLVAAGDPPEEGRLAASPLELNGSTVGHWLRGRRGARAIAVHAAWRTDPDTALGVVRGALGRARTPEPIRRARKIARLARREDRQPP